MRPFNLAELFQLISRQAYNEYLNLQVDLDRLREHMVLMICGITYWDHLNLIYAVRRFYKFSFSAIHPPLPLKWIWKSKCVRKFKFFAWLLLDDHLNTTNILGEIPIYNQALTVYYPLKLFEKYPSFLRMLHKYITDSKRLKNHCKFLS